MGKGLGAKNPNSNYIPISEVEQEALSRLVEADDLEIHIVGWGIVHKPRIVFGDLRVGCHFRAEFYKPAVPIPVWFFDLELRTRAGMVLYRERQPCEYGGKPLMVGQGVYFDMVWDIALRHMDPKVVKAIVPHAYGLTSRRQDRDTGDMTDVGNMHLTTEQKRVVQTLTEAEQSMRQYDLGKAVKATTKAGYKIKKTSDGLEAPEVV